MKEHLEFLCKTSFTLCLLLLFSCSSQTIREQPSGGKVRISPRLPVDQVRAEILKYTPTGSSADATLEFARNRLKHLYDGPDYDRRNAVFRHFDEPRKGGESVGSRSITVLLGRYGFNPLDRIDVLVEWAFDKNDRLIDVVVEKSRDAL